MNRSILHTEVQKYIEANLNNDTTTLLLKGKTIHSVSARQIVEQIEAKQKCKDKLPHWFNTSDIYYPNKLSIEQTSSEITADYKSKLISGKSIIDITGGFGIDCFYFSKQFNDVIHCEINETLSKIVAHNNTILGNTNTKTIQTDGIEYLKQDSKKFDWIYVDPSRRHQQKGKVFFLKDCSPDITKHMDLLFSRTNNIMVKTAPLLDISIGLQELSNVDAIHIISVKNEVKELLWILKKGTSSKPKINAVNFNASGQHAMFSFDLGDEQKVRVSYKPPSKYLYEPNVAIYKAGAFKLVASKLGVHKLHVNSHLYTSDRLKDFPGRRFKIEAILPYNKKTLKKELPKKANISIRNFPQTVKDIRKQLSIKDGGEHYLFFTTNSLDEKIVISCSKAD